MSRLALLTALEHGRLSNLLWLGRYASCEFFFP